MSSATLVLGGARSGKSAFAERLVTKTGLSRTYLATSPALDGEMAERIDRHKAQRGHGWHTIEEELNLVGALSQAIRPDRCVLVDCLTLWLNNLTFHGRDIEREIDHLVARIKAPEGPLFLVSNEIGMGLVPADPQTRAFRDAQGRLNQAVAAVCDRVIFVAAGLPLVLKPNSQMDLLA